MQNLGSYLSANKRFGWEGGSVQGKENRIVEWIKELEERRGKLDKQIGELHQETATIEQRITKLEEGSELITLI